MKKIIRRTLPNFISLKIMNYFALPLILPHLAYSSTLNLAWEANTEEDLAGYKLYLGTSSGNYAPPIIIDKVITEYKISGLKEGTPYYIALSAFDTSKNESEKSEEIIAITRITEKCSDGIDNDGDGDTDCEDDECDGLPCDDLDPCTTNDTCSSGICTGILLECSDGNVCTFDYCEEGQCIYECNALSSDDPCCNDQVCVSEPVCVTPVDTDGDRISDDEDNCPSISNPDQINSDEDSYGDACDNCPSINNEDQRDSDENGIGDLCEEDPFELMVEAEEMSYHANGRQEGDFWNLWANGTMGHDIYFPATNFYRFEIIAKGRLAYDIGPQMGLVLDGIKKFTVFVNTVSPKIYTFDLAVSEGIHEFAIGFYNDVYKPKEGNDRNLYVDKTIITVSPVIDIIEAEEMSYHANGRQEGDFWNLWANGTMGENIYFPNNALYQFEITAKGRLAYEVGPQMGLLIDGVLKRSVFVNNSSPDTFVFEVEVTEGVHEFAIGFYNDVYKPKEGIDRNLYVDKTILKRTENQ